MVHTGSLFPARTGAAVGQCRPGRIRESACARKSDGRSMPTTDLSDRLRWVRERVLRVSGEDLAAQLARLPEPWRHRVQPYTVARYETGTRAPSLNYLAALSELSGCSLDWLIKGEEGKGTALDAIRRMRHALDQIEEAYRDDPDDAPPDAFTPVG